MSALEITLLYLLAAVLGVVTFRSFKLPPMLGYLAVGVVIGPHALALAKNSAKVQQLGEYGVVLLMFVIGLEFSLPKLRSMRRHVFGLGLFQVVTTMTLATLGSLLLGFLAPQWWPMQWRTALALSGALAMSSTAIAVKLVSDRGELESPHGRQVMGVLLFQDLAVVPLLVLIPALASKPEQMLMGLGLACLKASLIIALLLTGGQRVMHSWLTLVARRKSAELFMLNLLLITLGLAWLTEMAGLSLALGAFIAGMLISETEYKHQVELDIKPFYDVLLGLFFISIGMLLDWRMVILQWDLVLLLLTLPLAFKLAVIVSLSKWLGSSMGDALRTGLFLTQAGEFGFVLLTLSQEHNLVPQTLINPILAAMVMSMLATPFVIQFSNQIVMRLVASEWLMQSLQMTKIASTSINTQDHVIICGYGRCGQNLARLLEKENIPYVALDLDPDRVKQATAAGHQVVFGDASRAQVLKSAGVSRASALVISYIDIGNSLKVLSTSRSLSPQLPVLVRTQDDHAREKLLAAGATEIVPEALEGSLMLASHTLALVGVPMHRVVRLVRDQREARYTLLKGYFHGQDDSTLEDFDQERLVSFLIPERAKAQGRTLGSYKLEGLGIQVLSLRRRLGQQVLIDDNTHLEAGDTLVLCGTTEALALAQMKLAKQH